MKGTDQLCSHCMFSHDVAHSSFPKRGFHSLAKMKINNFIIWKLDFCQGENADQLRSNCEADQRLLFSLHGQYNQSLFFLNPVWKPQRLVFLRPGSYENAASEVSINFEIKKDKSIMFIQS